MPVFLRTSAENPTPRRAHRNLAGPTALPVLLSLALGEQRLVLFVYVSVACGGGFGALRGAPGGVSDQDRPGIGPRPVRSPLS